MRILLLSLVCLAPLLAQDEKAVRDVVARYADARDRADEKAIAALFTNDADQLVSSGEWRKGKTDVVKGSLASSQSSTGKRTIAVESVRFLAREVAIADGRYEIGDRKMWSTFLITRTPDGWKISAIRNMLPAR